MESWKPSGPVFDDARRDRRYLTYALELCREFGIRGARRREGLWEQARRAEVAQLANVALFESTYNLERMVDPWSDVEKSNEWLLEVAAHVRPSLSHSNGYWHGAPPWEVPCLVVGHSCVYSWFEATTDGT